MTHAENKDTGLISGKVAAILNERELVINVGGKKGVTVGMKFKVLADKPTEIYDPDTNELLDIIDREKVRVEAFDVKDRLSVCKTYRTRLVGGTGIYPRAVGATLFGEPAREVTDTLKAEDSSMLPPLPEEESYVKRGDRVVQLTKAEEK